MAILLVLVMAVFGLSELRRVADARAILVTQNMARLMEQTYDGLIDAIDVSLQVSADEIGGQTSTAKKDPTAIAQFLIRQQQRIAHLAYIRAADEKGDLMDGAGLDHAPINIADREYFIRLRDDPQAGLVVAKPLKGRVNNKWVWFFARRINRPDGSFGGVVIAPIFVEELDRMLAKISLNAGDVATLRDTERGLIVQHVFAGNNTPLPGDKTLSPAFAQALQRDPAQGIYDTASSGRDDVARTHAYRQSEKYRYYVDIGISNDNSLELWRKQLITVLVLVSAFTLATITYARSVNQAWREQEANIAALQESKLFAVKIADTVPGMLAFWNADLHCEFANHAYLTWFGRSADEMQGISMVSLLGADLFAKNEAYIRGALAGEPQRFERLLVKANGDIGHTLAQYIPQWKDGKVVGFLALVTDISDFKKTQNALEQSLSEKDAVIKEVHHRVKNNLQVITSLLRLEAGRSTATETKAALDNMKGRIRAMAQLHELLYRSGTFASLDLGDYLGHIAHQAFHTQLLSDQRVQLTLHMDSVPVDMDQAIACGLLVNELVSNSLKHGFANGRSGEVRVELHPVDAAAAQTDALWRLSVRDTGIGLPPDFEDKREASLGLQLVSDLSLQANGTLTVQSEPDTGTEFAVVFKVHKPVPLVMPS